MPDITMCKGEECPIKFNCHRYTAKPYKYQSYFSEAPYDTSKKSCSYFWNERAESTTNQNSYIVNVKVD